MSIRMIEYSLEHNVVMNLINVMSILHVGVSYFTHISYLINYYLPQAFRTESCQPS